MKRALILFFLLSTLASAEIAPSNLIGNVYGRKTISLNGSWNAIVDPYQMGIHSRFYENAPPINKADLVEYNFEASGVLKVPGDWNTQRDTLLLYDGPMWYQKTFSFEKKSHTKVFLYVGAANLHARAWLNGKKLGEHEGGYTAFNFDVTDLIADGNNSVVFEVDSTRRRDAVPELHTDWWNYGGITRDVELVELPENYIQDYFVQLSKGSSEEISGWAVLGGASQSVTVEIPELQIKKTFPATTGRAEFRIPARPKLWSPDDPKLYRVIVSTPDDKVEEDIGFRTIETRGPQILLNGKPIFLRGISMHEEAPFRGGRAFSEEDDRTLLTWAKELGCNFVRLAHYPHNEHMTRMADRMGLLVWSEVPVYWDILWDNPPTLQSAQEQLRDMIARDHNRAAIILWSLSNETPPSPPRTEFLKNMSIYARSLDPTRLLTSAMNHTTSGGPNVRLLDDPLSEYIDVLGINEYMGWYESTMDDMTRTQWKTVQNKPLIISEFGADALYNKHGDAQSRFTEEYQVNLFEHQIAMLRKIPNLVGMSPWLLTDFRSPRRTLANIQDFRNRKGLISDRGERKLAFYTLQHFYREMADKK